jgi:hypothetical protein
MQWVMISAARSLNVPVFCWGHGASGQAIFTKQKTNELLLCDFYFTQGNGSQKTYSKYNNFNFVPLTVGLPTLDHLSKIIRKEDSEAVFDFLYVTTNYYQNN